MHVHNTIQFLFPTVLTESCAMNYCQDGLQVYYATETLEYADLTSIYGHYDLQPKYVNGKPYFQMMSSYGIWWNGFNQWWIGDVRDEGQSIGIANYDTDVFCPHQLTELNWGLFDGVNWIIGNNRISITCKCIVIQTKQFDSY